MNRIAPGALLLLIGATIQSCGAPPSSSPGEGFGPVRTVSAESGNGATPMYLITPTGARVFAWISAPGGGSDGRLHLRLTPARGDAVTTVELADSLGPIEPHGESPPQLAAASDGTLYLQYTVGKVVSGERFPRSALRLARSADEGRSWTAPVTVNEGEAFGAHNFHALLAGPDGRLYSSWLGSAPGGGPSLVWLRRSHDGGRSWFPTQILHGEPTCPCCRTALARSADGTLYAAWRKVLAGDVRDIVVARSNDEGATWSTPRRPREDDWVYPGCPHAGPSLRVDSAGSVHIAWWTGKENEAGVYYAKSTDRGESFSALPIATGPRSAPVHVQLALGRAGPIVVWDDGFGTMPRILLRGSPDGGGAFSEPVVLSPDGQAAAFPVIGVAGDSVLVAWSGRPVAVHAAETAAQAAHDPKAPMGLPKIGVQGVFERVGALGKLGN